MKKLIILTIFLSISALANAQSKKETQQIFYTCSMHPQIQVTKPGNCPICGMKLIKEK